MVGEQNVATAPFFAKRFKENKQLWVTQVVIHSPSQASKLVTDQSWGICDRSRYWCWYIGAHRCSSCVRLSPKMKRQRVLIRSSAQTVLGRLIRLTIREIFTYQDLQSDLFEIPE